MSLADLLDESKTQQVGKDARGHPQLMVTGKFGTTGLTGMLSPDFDGRRGELSCVFHFFLVDTRKPTLVG